jgi:hypothetical protein
LDWAIHDSGWGRRALCDNPQGSCNEAIGFPQLFLDGSRVANGIQVTSVMGTTIGPTTYLLNFTDFGIQVIGGHEVMILETWLGETNWDFVFNRTTGLVPRATAIDIHSNDHYILNSIVFSSLVGLKMGGAANMISGLHVWFPENRALQFGATAFLDTGSKNRYDGCYIDGSVATFVEPQDITWLDGFTLGGKGIVLQGSSASDCVFKNTEGGRFTADRNMTATNVIIVDNPTSRVASRATKSVSSAAPTSEYVLDFCDVLIFDEIQSVRHSFMTASVGRPREFPTLVASAPQPCKGSPTLLKIITIYLSVPSAGTVIVDVDSSKQTM